MSSIFIPSNENKIEVAAVELVEPSKLPPGFVLFLKKKLLWLLLAALLTLIVLIARLMTMPTFVESRDGFYFVRGLERYSVTELRPHWPGYPVYMWVGNFFKLFVTDPVQALHVLSVVAATLSIWPLAALAYGWRRASSGSLVQARLAAFVSGTIWALVPLSWLNGSEIFSDSLALLLALVSLWMCWRAIQPNAHAARWLLLVALLAGFMLGVRLSYVPLLAPLLYATWLTRKTSIKIRSKSLPLLPLLCVIALMLSISTWFSWQWVQEGTRLFEAGTQHLTEHYRAAGGRSVVSDENLLTRPLRFVETNLVYGLGGWWSGLDAPWLRLPLTVVLLALLLIGGWRLAKAGLRPDLILISLWLIPYSLWVLLSADVDLARYGLPIIAGMCLLMGLGLPRNLILGVIVLVAASTLLMAVTVPLAIEHHSSPPAGMRLTNYIKANLKPAQTALIVTDDAPVLQLFIAENAPAFRSIRFRYQELATQTWRLESQGRTVYATLTPATAQADWVAVARFCQGRFMESRGPWEVYLYKHVPPRAKSDASKGVLNPPLECS